jgi:GT2 family glycosyltransferase
MNQSKRQPLVSIIIPTYKRNEKLKNCLSSLNHSTYENYETIVVDDDPNFDLSEVVRQYGAKYFNNGKEVYPAKSRNSGARISTGEILFFVDDDNILESNTISNLVNKILESDHSGLLGPLMLNSKKELWFSGARANWTKPFLSTVKWNSSGIDLIETDAVPNAYMIRRELYFKIGGEDESLVFYNEEFDLALRLKNAGYKSYIYTGSTIVHDYGTLFKHLTPFRLYINIRGMPIVERRFASLTQFMPFSIYFAGYILFYVLYRIPYSMKVGNKKNYYKAILQGIIEGLFSTSRISPKYLINGEE